MGALEGLYLELLPNGAIKRNLVTENGEVELDASTVVTEIIELSELNFQHYATVLELIAYWSEQVQVGSSAEDFGKVDMEAFHEMIQVAYDLAAGLAGDNQLFGSLTKMILDDTIQRDDGTAHYVYNTKTAIEHQLEAIMRLQFRVNDALHDMSHGKPLDFEQEYPDLRRIRVAQLLTLGEELATQYHFRSMVEYYVFLFAHFAVGKPNVTCCECCGRYFIPKTKKKTLYCDRVIMDGKTCKALAPALKHKQKVSSDRVIAEYERAKRRMYKRMERTRDSGKSLSGIDLTYSEYYDWLDKATAIRDAYLRGEISEQEALQTNMHDEAKVGSVEGTKGAKTSD